MTSSRIGAVDAWSMPRHSAVGAGRIDCADFECAHRAPLSRPYARAEEIFRAVFGHRPPWLVMALMTRSRVGAWLGHDVSSAAEIRGEAETNGARIAGWPVHFISDEELVAGRDNPHLDFRVSVMKAADHGSAIISTVCWAHTAGGRAYLAMVAPLHRAGIQRLIAAAVRAGRL